MKTAAFLLAAALALGVVSPGLSHGAALVYIKAFDSNVREVFDVIVVEKPVIDEDGKIWVGNQECWNNPPGRGGGLMCILVAGKNARSLDPWLDPRSISHLGIPCNNPYFYRRFKLDWAKVPVDMRRRLWFGGGIKTSWDNVRMYFFDKVTKRHGGRWGPRAVWDRCSPSGASPAEIPWDPPRNE